MPSDGKPAGAIVALCGLPAAGKTTLAQRMLSEGGLDTLRCALNLPAVRLWHLSFDAVQQALEAESGALAFDPELWRAARGRVLAATRSHFGGDHGAPPLRELAASTSSAAAAAASSGGGGGSSSSCRPAESAEVVAFDIVLLDDNLHYRSMRRAYYRIARDARLAMSVVCLPVDVEVAVERDARRVGAARVGAPTIRVMSDALQWPDPVRHPWEEGCVTADELQLGLDDDARYASLCSRLAAVLSAPVRAEPPTGEAAEVRASEAAASAALTAESVLHQLDLRLRRATAAAVRDAHEGSGAGAATGPREREARAALGKLLAVRKREALTLAKRRLAAVAAGNEATTAPHAAGTAAEDAAVAAELRAEAQAEAVDQIEIEFALGLRDTLLGTADGAVARGHGAGSGALA